MPPTPPTAPTAEEPAPRFFRSPEEFRAWLARRHDQRFELWVGYWKKGTGEPSMTWAESVDVALCFGWIDGIRKSIDERRYKIRFTPRRPKSHWSARNLARMDDLLKADLVAPAGLAAYRNRDPAKVRQASYEQGDVALPPEYERELKTDPAAWRCWRAARPSYRKQVAWWIVSAKREETRRRRLKTLAEACAKGEVVPAMRWTEAGRKSERGQRPTDPDGGG